MPITGSRLTPIALLVVIILLVGCGNSDTPDKTPEPTATVLETTNISPATSSPAATVDNTSPSGTATATDAATPPSALASATKPPAVYTSVDASANGETFPTPNLAKKQQEMLPTAVIVEGEYPYPTANSALDSNGDGLYTIPELDQAIRETYPAYVWPEAYHPTIDEVFVMIDFNRIPEGAQFEVPGELIFLGSLHECAWQQNWLDAFEAGDQETMDSSMLRLRDTSLTNPLKVGVAASNTEIYNQAELGDPTRLIRDLKQNCIGFNRWVENRGSMPINNHWQYSVASSVATEGSHRSLRSV